MGDYQKLLSEVFRPTKQLIRMKLMSKIRARKRNLRLIIATLIGIIYWIIIIYAISTS